jgi:hypothetical protein
MDSPTTNFVRAGSLDELEGVRSSLFTFHAVSPSSFAPRTLAHGGKR